jgi:hypothetical protein
MHRLYERFRRYATHFGVATIIGSVVLLLMAGPASAHHPILAGHTVCNDDQHVVTWTIENSETAPGHIMTIASIGVAIGSTPYSVTGYAPTVAPADETHATTLVPGNVMGTIVLTVTGTWDGGYVTTAHTSVALINNCTGTTTTTAPETTTTTAPETTTTTAPETTTTTAPETTTTTAPETTTTTDVTTATTSTTIATTTTTGGTQGHEGGTTTTSTPPVTAAGSTVPPSASDASSPPVAQLGTPTDQPTGSLPFTGSGSATPLLGIVLFGAGVFLTAVGPRRSTRR